MVGGIVLVVIRGDGDWLGHVSAKGFEEARIEGSGASLRCCDLALAIDEE
jgi:hypothetical protein